MKEKRNQIVLCLIVFIIFQSNFSLNIILKKENSTNYNNLDINLSINKNNKEEECANECTKLSKIYSCFCDISCKEYDDCCDLYLKECENYFQKLKEKNLKNKIETNSFFSEKISNKTADGKNNKENLEGKCCDKIIEPFDCFCDFKCKEVGDCCSDFDMCYRNNSLKNNFNRKIKNERNLMIANTYKTHIDFVKINTLTPQIEMKYQSINKKENRLINKSPAEIKIKIQYK